MNSKVLKFIYKLFFILKAASDGWIVKYIGGDSFEFYKYHNRNNILNIMNIDDFIKKYLPVTLIN
jgi:hypothetical protein